MAAKKPTEKTVKQKGKFIIIVGPSASGKTELVAALTKRIPNSARLITTTTRAPRPGEKNDYFFVTREEFEKGIEAGDFFEYAEVYGNLYGPSNKVIESFREKYDWVFAIIDVKGARTLKSKIKDAVAVFLRPASIEDIRKRLLEERKETSKEELEKRLNTAAYEISLAPTFDFIVENRDGKFEETVEKTMRLIGVAP